MWVAQLRIMLPVALLSPFLYNTPTVALLIPIT
jgi:Na+/H+ antiporter NhaD/arsenite permease-like protein